MCGLLVNMQKILCCSLVGEPHTDVAVSSVTVGLASLCGSLPRELCTVVQICTCFLHQVRRSHLSIYCYIAELDVSCLG